MKNFCIACGKEPERVVRKVIRGGKRVMTVCSFCGFETEMMYETGRMVVRANISEWNEVPEGTLLIVGSEPL